MSYVVDKNGVKIPDAFMVIEYKGCKIMHGGGETLVYIGEKVSQCASVEDGINTINANGNKPFILKVGEKSFPITAEERQWIERLLTTPKPR